MSGSGAQKDVQQAEGRAVYEIIIDGVRADPKINKMPPRPRRSNEDRNNYSFCAQLIKWYNGGYSIRLAYYRSRAGEDYCECVSQTTITSDWKMVKALLERTLAKERWLKNNPEE